MGSPALGALRAFRQEFFRRMGPPGIAALRFKDIGHFFDSRFVDQRFPAVLAVENGNRDAPDALTADAPVVAVGNHVVDARFAPGRNPLDFVVDGVQGGVTEAVDRSEPLFRRAVDDGVFAAPAMGVLMVDVLLPRSMPSSARYFRIGTLASKTNMPWKRSPASAVILPCASTGQTMGTLYFRQVR